MPSTGVADPTNRYRCSRWSPTCAGCMPFRQFDGPGRTGRQRPLNHHLRDGQGGSLEDHRCRATRTWRLPTGPAAGSPRNSPGVTDDRSWESKEATRRGNRPVVDIRKHRIPGQPLVLTAREPLHAGPCDHGPCTLANLLAVERLDDPRCCVGHHPEAVRSTT